MTEDPNKNTPSVKEISSESEASGPEQERREMNEQCVAEMKQTIDRVRNAWPLAEEGVREKIKNMCEYRARQYEILLELLSTQEDLTRGYTKLADAIAGNHKTREHTKRLSDELVAEFNRRVGQEFKWDQELTENRAGFKKTSLKSSAGKTLFTKGDWDYNAYNFGYSNPESSYESRRGISDEQKKLRERGINRSDYNLGHNLEKTLGGDDVGIKIDEGNITIKIIEIIQQDSETKKYYIDPETKIDNRIGRLVVPAKMIPTISDIDLSRNWRDYYQE